MNFDQILCGPEWIHLYPIATGKAPILVSAFYSGAMLTRLSDAKPSDAKLLVRLPTPSGPIPRILPNDPRTLLTFAKRNPSVRLFVHPKIHAKVYVSDKIAMVGSANLSMAGFGGSYEASLLTKDAATVAQLRISAQDFVDASQPADIKYLERLIHSIAAGKAVVQPTPDASASSAVAFATQAGNPPFESFVAWLASQKSDVAQGVYDRCKGKNNLSGHAYSAYHGLCVIFRGDPTWARSLAGKDWQSAKVSAATERIRDFVEQNPQLIRNRRKGYWETSYLPPNLGGPKDRSGGAGIGLIKAMMVVLPQYLRTIHLI